MIWLGVDPGLSGAFAAIARDGSIMHLFDMPLVRDTHATKNRNNVCEHSLRDELISFKHEHGQIHMAVVEMVSTRPGQAAGGVLRTGINFGKIQGILAALCVPTHNVAPAKWKKYMGLNSDKEASLGLARAKWPSSEYFALKKHDGRAEAALIAEYGRRIGL